MSVFDQLFLNLYVIPFALNFHNSESSRLSFRIGLHDTPSSPPVTTLGSKLKWSLGFRSLFIFFIYLFFSPPSSSSSSPPQLGRTMSVSKMLMLFVHFCITFQTGGNASKHKAFRGSLRGHYAARADGAAVGEWERDAADKAAPSLGFAVKQCVRSITASLESGVSLEQ